MQFCLRYNSGIFKDCFCFLLIFSFCIFYAINNFTWLKLNQCPPVDDEAYHLDASLTSYDILSDSSQNVFIKIKNLFQHSVIGFYPVLFHTLAAINNLIFGRTMIVSIMTNVLFIAITFLGIYLIGKKIQDRTLGLLAVFIFAMYPIIFWLSRVFLIGTALCSILVISIVCLIYTDNFSSRPYSILFGFFLGIGMLIKQTFIFYIIGPFIFTILNGLFNKNDKIKRKKRLSNLIISFLIGIFFVLLWYLPKIKLLLPKYFRAAFFEHNLQNYFIFSFRSFRFYINLLISEQLLPCFSILFFLSLIQFIFIKNKYKNLLIVWILIPWIIFTLIRTKTAYYTVPLLPAIALISSRGILTLRSRFLKIFSISFFIVFGLWQYFIISYGNESVLYIHIKKNQKAYYRIYFMPVSLGGEMRPYVQRGDWKVEEIFNLIDSNRLKNRKITILVTHVDGNFLGANNIPWRDNNTVANKDMLNYTVHFKQLPYKVVNIYDKDYKKNNYSNLPEGDFLISNQRIEDLGIDLPGKYNLLDVFIMPDKSMVHIYKNIMMNRKDEKVS